MLNLCADLSGFSINRLAHLSVISSWYLGSGSDFGLQSSVCVCVCVQEEPAQPSSLAAVAIRQAALCNASQYIALVII